MSNNPHNFPTIPIDGKCPECGFKVPWLGWAIDKGLPMCKFCKEFKIEARLDQPANGRLDQNTQTEGNQWAE